MYNILILTLGLIGAWLKYLSQLSLSDPSRENVTFIVKQKNQVLLKYLIFNCLEEKGLEIFFIDIQEWISLCWLEIELQLQLAQIKIFLLENVCLKFDLVNHRYFENLPREFAYSNLVILNAFIIGKILGGQNIEHIILARLSLYSHESWFVFRLILVLNRKFQEITLRKVNGPCISLLSLQ